MTLQVGEKYAVNYFANVARGKFLSNVVKDERSELRLTENSSKHPLLSTVSRWRQFAVLSKQLALICES